MQGDNFCQKVSLKDGFKLFKRNSKVFLSSKSLVLVIFGIPQIGQIHEITPLVYPG